LVALFTIAVTALDQATKAIVVANLHPGVEYPFLGSLIRLYLVYNNSAAFSLGFGQTWIFAIVGAAAFVAIVWYLRKLSSNSWLVLAGILAGGILGNLSDRLFRSPGFGSGLVVDFSQIPFNFPIFNLADTAIVCVAVAVVIRIMLGHQPLKK